MRILITGNPNVGKTTIFNDLTSANEKVANYCGITTGATTGSFFDNFGKKHCVVDLPGTYSLSAYSPEELSVSDAIFECEKNVVIHVLDANNLSKGLYFATQVLDIGLPTVVVLTMSDIAAENGMSVDCDLLEEALGVPVIKLQNCTKDKKRQLRQIVSQKTFAISHFSKKSNDEIIEKFETKQTNDFLKKVFKIAAFQEKLSKNLPEKFVNDVVACKKLLFEKNAKWRAEFIKNRYALVDEIANKCVLFKKQEKSINLDKILLHNIFGPILVFLIFGFVLFSTFYIAEFPIKLLEYVNDSIKNFIASNFSQTWLIRLFCEGILGGFGNVILFLPQFMIMIAFMSALENTGYLARASFLMNKWMAFFGLSGQSFSSLVSCYACTVPGIMQSRCIRNSSERLTTLIIAPLMPCSGRIPVYLLLISLMFDNLSAFQKTLILITVYVFSTLLALTLSTVIRKFFLKTTDPVYVMEMPHLSKPRLANILTITIQHTALFLKKAGTLILIFSAILWACMNLKTSSNKSIVQDVGETIEPIIKPLGYDWHIGIGLLSGLIARENLISTLGVLHNTELLGQNNQSSSVRLLLKSAKDENNNKIYSFATCLSLLVFLIISMQCIGTIVFIAKETSVKWALLQFIIINSFAYICALATYIAVSGF